MARIVPQKQRENVGDGSTLLAVDSSETVTMTDLDTLGMTAVQFSQGVSVGGGGGGSSPGDVPPSMYVALCNAVVHDPAFYYYVQANGTWVSDLRDTVEQAQFDVQAHDDGQAFLCIQVGTNLIGPYTPPHI